VEIKKISWMQALPVRHEVLWPLEEQSFCKVEGDEHGQHFGAYVNDQLVCVASIYTEDMSARLRKFATIREHQGNGIGTEMLKCIVSELKIRQIEYFWFDARESATGFYSRLGFEIEGERFFKNRVPYVKMSMSL